MMNRTHRKSILALRWMPLQLVHKILASPHTEVSSAIQGWSLGVV
jgi:hypothetical protein